MTLQALIFDVDGTLAETERDGHRVAFNAAFADAGLSWHWDVALYGELLAVTGGKERMHHYIARWKPDGVPTGDIADFVARLHAAKTAHYVRCVESGALRLRPGIARLIHEARAVGLPLAIATTTTAENVHALLAATLGPDSPAWFAAIGAGDVVPRKKPAPDIYQWVLWALGLKAADCLAIEDSAAGLAAARAAGAPTVVTVSEYTVGQDFSGALAVVSDLDAGKTDLATLQRWHADVSAINYVEDKKM